MMDAIGVKGKPQLPYLYRRLLQIVPLVFSVIGVNFILIHTAPGDPVYYLAGEAASAEFFQATRVKLGLDRPLYEQLFTYIVLVLRGDLGYSFVYRQPVSTLILSRVPATLLLMVPAYVISLVLGIVIGAISAEKRYSKLDVMVTIAAFIGYSMPVFWVGTIVLMVFAVNWKLFPVSGMFYLGVESSGIQYFADILHHLFLPSLVLAISNITVTARLARGSTLEALAEDYIVTARSKGLGEREVLFRHALRNALLPVVTVTGMRAGTLIAGAVLTETVFAWPGLGRLLYDALSTRDYPVVMGMFLFVSVMVALSNLITDFVYTLLDPRIRYAKFR